MKKFLFLISVIIVLSIFLGSCDLVQLLDQINKNNDTEESSNIESESEAEIGYTPAAIHGFSEYLDHEGFDHTRLEGTSTHGLEKYKYEGETVKDLLLISYADGYNGWENFAESDFCGFWASVRQDWRHVVSKNRFSAYVQLENLDSPYGVTFDDDIHAALKKIGIEEDVIENFVSDDDNQGVMTLQRGSNFSLTLSDMEKMPESAQTSRYRYAIKYTESYTLDKTTPKDIMRYVSLLFSDENSALEVLTLYIESCYERESDEFSQYLDDFGFNEGIFGNEFDIIEAYKAYGHDGKTVKELYGDWILDESDAVRYYIDGDLFGAEIIKDGTNDEYIKESVRVYGNSPFDLLYPPSGMATYISLSIKSIGFDVDVIDNFVSDEGNEGVMTLYSDESKFLTVTDHSLTPETEQNEHRYKVTYKQTYESLYEGRKRTVTRYVELLYKDEVSLPGSVTLYIEAAYDSIE